MARNRGKRPGAASGSTSPSQRQAESGQTKASEASAVDRTADDDRPAVASGQSAAKAPASANHAIAAKVDPPAAASKPADQSGKAAAGQAAPSGGVKTGASSESRASTKTTPASSAAAPTSPTSQAGARPPASTATTSGGGSSGGGGFWPGLIGGVIGGAAAAFAIAAYWAGDNGEATAALEGRMAAAEQQVSQFVQQQGGDMDALAERLAAVEAAPGAEGDAGLGGRLDDVEARLAALGEAPAGGGDGGLGEELSALQQQVEALTALQPKLDTLSGQVQTASDAQQASAGVLDSLQGALPTLEDALAATGLALEQTSERTEAIGQSVETLSGDVQSLAGRVGEAESALDHLGGEYQRGAAMIVAIGDVERAIARAEPFDSSLQTLSSLLKDDAQLGETVATLEPMATDGVPSLAELQASYGPMASRVLLAEEGDPSLADKVGNNVFGIINMRPAGAAAEGGSSRAVLARAQAAVSAGDLDGAVGELEALDGAAAEQATDWVGHARARLAAEAALVELRSHAQSLVAKGS